MSNLLGLSKGSNTTVPTLSPAQNAMINAQTGLFTSTIAPAYQQAVNGGVQLYNQTAPGYLNAAQNVAGVANQAQQTLGSTGQSALNTGVSGLESLFSPSYEANQIATAMAPAEAQYQQNIANQGAQFGGAGQLGSARQALAGQQLAGTTQALQAQTAAGIENQVAQNQLSAGSQLAGIGQTNLSGAQVAAGNQLTAAGAPLSFFGSAFTPTQYGVPSTSYNPSFAGTQATTTSNNSSSLNISDIRTKENIEYVGTEKGHKIYHFNYKGKPERYSGVMADDVKEYMPNAIHFTSDGYMMVDYDMLGVKMKQIGKDI
jgi:hypothetical protein